MNVVALALLEVVKRVGRWLIRRLLKFGHTKVMAFVELRIEQVTRRGKRARTPGIPSKDRCAAARFQAAKFLPGLPSSTRSAHAANQLLARVPDKSDMPPDKTRNAHTC